jgi:hypothetical protein
LEPDYTFLPLSIVLKSGDRLLAYGLPHEDQDGSFICRGAVMYSDEDDGIHICDYDPTTDDEYVVFSISEIMTINSMSDAFLVIYKDYHNSKNQLDLSELTQDQLWGAIVNRTETYQ